MRATTRLRTLSVNAMAAGHPVQEGSLGVGDHFVLLCGRDARLWLACWSKASSTDTKAKPPCRSESPDSLQVC